MATRKFLGNAAPIAQVDTLTPGGTIAIGNTFTVTINSKSITYTAVDTLAATVATGVYTLLAASIIPEFKEITWADATGAVTGTSKVTGRPFTVTVSKAQGSGGTDLHTFARAATTASSGPSDISLTANWSAATKPVNGDTIDFENLAVDVLYNVDDLTALTGVTINVKNFRGAFGLPEYNAAGYDEYRPTYVEIGATVLNYDGTSTRAKFDLGDPGAPSAVTVTNSGASTLAGVEAILIKGGTATNHIDLVVNKGSVGVAVLSGETAEIGSFLSSYKTNVLSDAKVRFGTGVTFNDDAYTMVGGQVESNSNVATVIVEDGTAIIAAGTIGTLLENKRGTVIYNSSATVTKYIGMDSTLDLRQRTAAFVATDMTLFKDAKIEGGEGLFTVTNPILLSGCSLEDVQLPREKDITVALVAA